MTERAWECLMKGVSKVEDPSVSDAGALPMVPGLQMKPRPHTAENSSHNASVYPHSVCADPLHPVSG